jgi:hypothetical protein
MLNHTPKPSSSFSSDWNYKELEKSKRNHATKWSYTTLRW